MPIKKGWKVIKILVRCVMDELIDKLEDFNKEVKK